MKKGDPKLKNYMSVKIEKVEVTIEYQFKYVRLKGKNDQEDFKLFEDTLFYKNYFEYHTMEKVNSYMALQLLMLNKPFYARSEKMYLHFLDQESLGEVTMIDLLMMERIISNRNFYES